MTKAVGAGNVAAFGDAEVRTKDILEAAAGLLAEGGYPALTMRAIAQRSQMSAGLIYRYFADKRDVFATLLHHSQLEIIALVRAADDSTLEGFLRRVAPPIIDQWFMVGRMAGSFIDGERKQTPATVRLGESTREQFEALEAGLRRAAAAEGLPLDPSTMMTRFVWASLMGLAESLMLGWYQHHDRDALIEHTAAAIARGITV